VFMSLPTSEYFSGICLVVILSLLCKFMIRLYEIYSIKSNLSIDNVKISFYIVILDFKNDLNVWNSSLISVLVQLTVSVCSI
jgi:hypothetical protein